VQFRLTQLPHRHTDGVVGTDFRVSAKCIVAVKFGLADYWESRLIIVSVA
jgi:hypothetical protein